MPGMPMDAATRGATDSRVLTWLSQHGRSLERFVAYAQATRASSRRSWLRPG